MEVLSRQQVFIDKSKAKYADKFDYSYVDYINSTTKITLKCNPCDSLFEQTTGNHLYGFNGCKECNRDNANKALIKPLENVIADFKKIHRR